MKYLSLFSGIGAFEKALDYLNVKYELVNYCEIDKYASKSYSMIHSVPESMNLGDITKVDTSKLPKDIDLISYGFPCQDISLAGKQKGFFQENIMQALRNLEFTDDEIKNLYIYISTEKPSDSQLFDKLYDEFLLYEDDINALLLLGINKLTRSGLFFEALRIIESTKPKVAIAENVKNLVSKKFKTEFGIVLKSLEEAGYNNYWQVLNAKNYGVPQNRERVFIVSIRKDIDNGSFKFPEPYELKLRLKDMLEDEVDEKYYLSGDLINTTIYNEIKDLKKIVENIDKIGDFNDKSIEKYNHATKRIEELESNLLQVGNLTGGKWDKINESCRRVYDPEGLAPTIHTCQGGNTEPKVMVTAAAMRGRGEGWKQQVEISDREYANTITTVQKDSLVAELPQLRIRKLTPTECFRLMGFEDEVINTLLGTVSNTQLYKQAGNSIVVDVLEEIFVELFKVVNLNAR